MIWWIVGLFCIVSFANDTLSLPELKTHKHGHSPKNNLAQSFTTIHPWALEKNQGNTMADILKSLPGVDVRTMGPAPARPTYRGLSGDRIKVLENESPIQDLSGTSPDHAVTLDPLSIQDLMLLKGPQILLYSSSTLGGLIHAQSQDSPEYIKHRHLRILNSGQTVNHSLATSAQFQMPLYESKSNGYWSSISLGGGLRNAGNTQTPQVELENSGLFTHDYNIATQNGIHKNQFHFGIQNYQSEYGIPPDSIVGHPQGVDIEMARKKINALGIYNNLPWTDQPVRLQYDETYYNHIEYESKDYVGASYNTHNYRGHLQIPLPQFLLENQKMGSTLTYYKLKMGGNVFTPPVNTINTALFYTGEKKIKKLQFHAGIRFEQAQTKTFVDRNNKIPPPERSFYTWASGLTAEYQWNNIYTSGITLSRSARIPTPEELYSNGPHLAAYSYDIGDHSLKSEIGYGLEIEQYIQKPWGKINFQSFLNEFTSYIQNQASGDTNIRTRLPIYKSKNIAMRSLGFESTLDLKITSTLHLQPQISYVWSVNVDSNTAIPMTPPLKGKTTLQYKRKLQLVEFQMDWNAPQKRVDEFEGKTDGYILYSLFLQQGFHYYVNHRIHFGIENILNTEYRNHLSRLKKLKPESGRNFKMLISQSF